MFTTDPFVVSTSVLKVDPVLDFFPSVSWCFWGVRSNRGGTLLSFVRSRCSFGHKTGKTLIEAFEVIFKLGRQPICLQTDRGTEFTNRVFQKFLKENDVHFFTTYNDDDLFHTRPLDVREIVVSLVYARCRHTVSVTSLWFLSLCTLSVWIYWDPHNWRGQLHCNRTTP
jgi:hypothetical protein